MPSVFSPVGADPDDVRSHLGDHRAEFRAQLAEWVTITSVAGALEHSADVRRASDAKGQLLQHLWAIRIHLDACGDDAPPVNLRLIVSGAAS
jgi:hypothetical protein